MSVTTRLGWDIVTLRSAYAEVEVLPGKGGDILSVRRPSDGVNLLWSTPWGLRPRGALSAATDSEGRLMEAYPGGWQTVFPNGGNAASAQGTTWGMHGEAWLAPFDWHLDASATTIEMTAELVHSPFRILKRITVDGPRVAVTETITHRGGHSVDVMWSHHPAFGPPFLSADCVIDSTATHLTVDAVPPGGPTDVQPGATGTWPHVASRPGGEPADLRRVPHPRAGVSRMAYLSGFPTGLVTLRNTRLDLGARLEWNATLMPYAWYWLEAAGTPGFPWYQGVYVLGIEPATSIPGLGIEQAQAAGTTISFTPGTTRTAEIALTLTDGAGR
ncbi:hypothetical protein GCM10022224_075460 [Nonomuraea antimicrobica]|uniref:Galactose mutarotase n=1 Tax=Nonomuraea antimicrobica TaxID=561173 RepID=A0ABP7CZ17_9ACTN